MTTTVRRALAIVGAAFALLLGAVIVPALAAPAAAPAPPVVRLHLGTDAQYFAYGSTQQALTTAKNGCQLTSPKPLIDLSSLGSTLPGLANQSIGVKSSGSGANGSPCGQVSEAERLTLRPGTTLSSRLFSKLRLDLEMTGNAHVVLRLSRTSSGMNATYDLLTGTSITPDQASEPDYDQSAPYTVSSSPGDTADACAAPNSSGPNNAGNDNCLWTVTPGFDFDTITLFTTVGTVSLEGGADFGNSADHESLFYLANSAPTAADDAVVTNEDTAVSGNVLTNDTDSDGDSLAVVSNTNPSHGTVTVAGGGSFTYTPGLDYNGPDSFTYTISDGNASATATVGITVTPVNDAPVPVNGTASTPEDTAVTITVATDVDSTNLTATCTSTAGGTFSDNGDGTVTYRPPANFNGSDTISCSVSDGALTTATNATVTVGVTPVNDAPVAADDTADVNQNSSSTVIDVLNNDNDIDGDTLSVTNVSDPANGSAVSTGAAAQYTPDPGFTGTDTFTYTAYDGTSVSNTATVTITVFPVICSGETVTATDGNVSGSFTRLSDETDCKRYELAASSGTVRFVPQGASTVTYRAFLQLDPEPAPVNGVFTQVLEYDPAGGFNYRPVQWCIDPQFDPQGVVTSATLPSGETWCIASSANRGSGPGNVVTVWQVYGEDDPRFK